MGFSITNMKDNMVIWAGYVAQDLRFFIILQGFAIFQENWKAPQPVILAIAYSPCGPLP